MKICLYVRNNTKNTFHVMKKKIFFFQTIDLIRILINVPKNKCKRNKRITFHVIKFCFFFQIKNIIIVIFTKILLEQLCIIKYNFLRNKGIKKI